MYDCVWRIVTDCLEGHGDGLWNICVFEPPNVAVCLNFVEISDHEILKTHDNYALFAALSLIILKTVRLKGGGEGIYGSLSASFTFSTSFWKSFVPPYT